MDKSEYRAKLDHITAFINAGDYQNAQTIVDEVDWRRVKSARTLCMISEVYEKNDRLPDSRKVLELAYKRALIKTVAYRLVEVCLKLKDVDAAQDYYEDFVDLAPMDNSKYILKYKIHKAKGDPLSQQIKALEEYKEREYTEPWAYELAKLYSQDGNKEACIDACDDLILWFSEGPYVLNAMELKKKYVPLSPSQQEKYKKEMEAKAVKAAVPSFLKPAAAAKHTEDTKAAEAEHIVEIDPEIPITSAEEAIEKMDTAASSTVQAESSIKLPFGKMMAGAAKQTMDPGRMQSQLADSIRNVFAGINNKGTVQLENQASEIEEKYDTLHQEDMSEYEIKDLEPEAGAKENVSASDVVLSVSSTEEPKENDQIEGQMSFEDFAKKESEFDFEALFAETTNALAMELASGKFEKEKVVNTEEEAEMLIEEEIAKIVAEGTKTAETIESKETEAEFDVPVIDIPEEDEIVEEPEAKDIIAEIHLQADDAYAESKKQINELESVFVSEDAEDLNIKPKTGEGTISLELQFEKNVESESTQKADEKTELEYLPVEPRPLTDEEKEIFTYFSNIPGLGDQITMTLCDVHNNAGDKTSRSGNFLVIGRQGSGKTRLYESMVLAICKDLGMDAAKNAKVVARDFNHKDPAAVVAKLSGGFLAIEGAGELSDEAAEKLAQAMEFRTDSLVVVLEDEKDDLMQMLQRNPRLAEKFTASIKIPVFTNDELVTFAKIYAQDQGYRMDEMGILALYTKIGDNQKDSEPITVGRVKQMMDDAMLKANKGHRKLSRRFSKNAVDEENRIILFEKDFE